MFSDDEEEDLTTYKVVVNHEEQYSIWPADRENPLGWKDSGPSGPKAECLAYINEVWTDMRPLSLRKHMEEVAKQQAENPPPPPPPPSDEPPPPDELVTRLAKGDHQVEVGLRPEKTAQAFKEAIDRGYVHIKFTETKGGTELGVRLDTEKSHWNTADFNGANGPVHIEGNLTLNFVKVRCIADVELNTLQGKGHLEILPDN